MVGRSGELAALEAHLEATTAGQGRVIAISGEAGIGKSRLIAALAGLAAERGYSILRGECQSYGVTIPYLPWHAIWREIFGIAPIGPDAPTPAEQIAALRQAVGAVDQGWIQLDDGRTRLHLVTDLGQLLERTAHSCNRTGADTWRRRGTGGGVGSSQLFRSFRRREDGVHCTLAAHATRPHALRTIVSISLFTASNASMARS